MPEKEVVLSCSQCNSDRFKFWAKEYTGSQIVKCDLCQLRLVSPRKEMETLEDEVYSEETWKKENLKYSDLERQKNSFLYDYLSLMKGMEYCDASDPAILDIGSGRGGFLKMAKSSGFDNLTGLDINGINKPALEKLNIPLIEGHINHKELTQYDLINAQHVLEHVSDPYAFLTRVKELLNPTGVVHIVVPNESSLISREKSFLSRLKLKSKPFKHLTPWHHFFFFDKKSLIYVLEDVGFKVVYVGTRHNIKSKGLFYQWIHQVFDRLKINSHLEVVAKLS